MREAIFENLDEVSIMATNKLPIGNIRDKVNIENQPIIERTGWFFIKRRGVILISNDHVVHAEKLVNLFKFALNEIYKISCTVKTLKIKNSIIRGHFLIQIFLVTIIFNI